MRYQYTSIFLNDGTDEDLITLADLPKSVVRIIQSALTDDIVFVSPTGERQVLSNEENALIESGIVAVTSWT